MKQNFPVPMRRHHHEVADIFNLYGDQYRQENSLSYEQIKVMRHIQTSSARRSCRTMQRVRI